jgi:hypothetical protein
MYCGQYIEGERLKNMKTLFCGSSDWNVFLRYICVNVQLIMKELFYRSQVTGWESKILLFRPAVIKCGYVLQQIYCDFQKWDL